MAKRVMTGLKPTGSGELHLGNYVGALRPLAEFAQAAEHEVFLMIADYHTLINVHDQQQMQDNVDRVAAAMFALFDQQPHVKIYRQSAIAEILELSFILSCFSSKGLMNRAHAYKAMLDNNRELGRQDEDQGVSMGLFTYPILMSADILIFQPDLVPVGPDQHQHLEIARDICQTFNHQYKADFRLPATFTPEHASTLLGLDGRKMSKSYNNTIPIFCTEKRLQKLINKIKTDSAGVNEPKDADSSILFSIYCQFSTAEQQQAMRQLFTDGAGYGDIKRELFSVVNHEIAPLRASYEQYLSARTDLRQRLSANETELRLLANDVLRRFKDCCGLL